ncbi:hypothetical protein D3C76_1183640 [compost metagenome]
MNSSTSLRAVYWKRAGERSSNPRSKPAVAIATCQPCPSAPMRLATGTRTSSKNTSAKASLPLSALIGRMLTPGASSGTIRNDKPWWRLEPGSLRNRPNSQSAKIARVDQVFWPLST